jgi:hypothetical protein
VDSTISASGIICVLFIYSKSCLLSNRCITNDFSYCVGTRRKAVIDRKDVETCRLILGSDHATNFESRMVSEVHLYWIIYESSNSAVDLPKTQAALHSWKEEWKYLFGK